MKKLLSVVCLVAVLGLSACAGTFSAGNSETASRMAGSDVQTYNANKAFNKAMRK